GLLDISAGGRERGTCCNHVTACACDETFVPSAWEPNVLLADSIRGHACERTVGSGGITVAQGKLEPLLNKTTRGCRILSNDRLNGDMQRFRICAPFEINGGAC